METALVNDDDVEAEIAVEMEAETEAEAETVLANGDAEADMAAEMEAAPVNSDVEAEAKKAVFVNGVSKNLTDCRISDWISVLISESGIRMC